MTLIENWSENSDEEAENFLQIMQYIGTGEKIPRIHCKSYVQEIVYKYTITEL